MNQQEIPTLLTIGASELNRRNELLDIYTASTLREALATIRLIRFDLLVVGLDKTKLDVWELMHRVLAAWPHQRWLVVAKRITAEEEVRARSLGVLMVLDDLPNEDWLADFIVTLRRRDLSNNVFAVSSAAANASLTGGVSVRAGVS